MLLVIWKQAMLICKSGLLCPRKAPPHHFGVVLILLGGGRFWGLSFILFKPHRLKKKKKVIFKLLIIFFFPLSVHVFSITTPKIKKSDGAGGFLVINNMQKCVSISKRKRSLLPSWVISRTNKTRAPISL